MTTDVHSHRTKVSKCLSCDRMLDGATTWDTESAPQAGDATVCCYCGHLMIFGDDLALRQPNDDEIVALAGDKRLLMAQKVTAAIREKKPDWRDVPVPTRMRHLPRDPRGYPIFVMAYRDSKRRVHFTINDETMRQRVVAEDRCSVCGERLLRGRWFVGGEKSAFHPNGAYIDPPMHGECAHYALQVCPYLAAPNYDKLIAGATVAEDDPTILVNQTAINSPSTAAEVRPALFVAVLARGQRLVKAPGGFVIRPTRPYIDVEYWQHGRKLTHEQGEAIVAEAMPHE